MDAYDCIIGEYCDPGVEKKYLEKLHHDKNSHRVNALKRMPIQTRISEGMLYNILSLKQNEVFLPEQKRQAELKSRDPEPTMGYLHNIEVRERDHKEQQLKLERATHRISKQRWAPIVERGYDITSNEPNVNSAIAQGLRRRLHELKLEPEYDSLHGNYVWYLYVLEFLTQLLLFFFCLNTNVYYDVPIYNLNFININNPCFWFAFNIFVREKEETNVIASSRTIKILRISV